MIKRLLTVLVPVIFLCSARSYAMTLNVQEGDLHSTVLMIAAMGGLNVAVDDSVKGAITIALEDVEPREALEIVAKTKDLKLVEENGIIMITALYLTNSLMDAYVLPVRYGDAEVYRTMLVNTLELEKEEDDDNETRRVYHRDGTYTEYRRQSNETKRIDNDKRVMVDKDANALILYGTAAEYERAKKILSEIDVPLKQVSIEAKIMAIDKSATKDLGVDWFWSTIPQYADYNPTTTTTSNNTTTVTESYYTRKQDETTGYGVLQFGRVPNAYVPYEWYFGARLNALITNGKAKMLSKPNIMTVQGHEATINVGSSVPVPSYHVSNSITTTSIEYRDAGIILKVTPRVNADGSITALIHTEVSTPQYVSDLKAYRFNNRSADTTVTVRDGEPLVIGGLIGADEEKSIRKIPFLGDLPILGSLFKSVRRSKSDSELVIFLTAHVIDN